MLLKNCHELLETKINLNIAYLIFITQLLLLPDNYFCVPIYLLNF